MMKFNLSEWALSHRSFVLYLMVALALIGVGSYGKLGQSEDPPFTFKVMVVRTEWPGATAHEVEQQVTEQIEKKLQETPHLDFLQSYSRPGESLIFIMIRRITRRRTRYRRSGARYAGRWTTSDRACCPRV